jgi:hypothetical protein
LVRIATGPEPERAVSEVLLIDRLQQHHNGPLRHFVLERRNAQCTLTAVRLVNVVTPNRRCTITTRFEPVEQTLQVLLQIGRIGLRRLTVNSYRAVLASALVGVPQPLGIEVLVQRRKRHGRLLPRQLGYPLLFR